MSHDFGREQFVEALTALGVVMTARGFRYELVLVGGGNLLLRGIIDRPTRDGDILGERLASGRVIQLHELPDPLRRAVLDVALTYALPPDWLNVGPASLLELGLPPGFETRLTSTDFGGIRIWFAASYDLVCFKLYAAADHWPTKDRHLADLRALRPTRGELLAAAEWVRTHDPSPDFRSLLVAVLVELGIEDADAAAR